MGIKLLADKYVELNVKNILEISNENYKKYRGVAENNIFLLCSFGEMKVVVKKMSYTLKENDILLITCDSSYMILDGRFTAIAIEFNGASADELIYSSIFSNNPYLSSEYNLGFYIYKIFHAYNEAEYLSIKCLGLLYEFFYELTRQSNFEEVEPDSKVRHIEMAKEFIIQNYQKDISVGDIAKKAGVTSNYLANIFSTYYHKTPKLYLTEIRMEQAKKLLITQKYKVKDVGKLVGYKNQLHFSGEFKKYTGLSPLNYAKKFKR